MSRVDRLLAWCASFLYRHPWVVLFLVALSVWPAAWGAWQLKLRPDWTELLPENKRSIIDLRRIQRQVGGTGTLTVFLEGGALSARQRFADDLAPRIARYPKDLVRFVDKDLKEERAFFESSRWFFADLEELREIRDELKARVAEAKSAEVLDLGLDEEEAPPTGDEQPPARLKEIQGRYADQVASLEKYPSGYFTGEGDRVLVVFVRTAFSSNQLDLTRELLERVQADVAALGPHRYDPAMEVRYTGDLLTARDEHDSIRDELLVVSAICISLILVSIYLFYFEFRAIFVLGAGILVGLAWTFGLTYAYIGYLNTATAFLSSIVAGNGINSGIILIARYLEERRRNVPIPEAMRISMTGTWAATVIATAAASISYGVLMLTDFRGFQHFGYIGGVGLLLCWLANYVVVPTLLGLTDRRGAKERIPRERGWNYGRPFLAIASRAPLTATALSAFFALLGLALGYNWIAGDPFEYDFRKLRNERSTTAGAGLLQNRVNELLKGRPGEAMVVLADREDQVPLLEAALDRIKRERARQDGGLEPIGEVRTLQGLVPRDQAAKLPLLAEIRDLALQVLPRLSGESQAELKPWVPPAELTPVAAASVPRSLRRLFVEKDGRQGRIVLVSSPRGISLWDGRGLLKFADAVRAVELPNGEVVHSSHRSVVFADMLESILHDGPWLTLASFVGVVALVFVAFRRITHTALILFTLLIGMGWMIGLMAITTLEIPWLAWATPIKLNFLNFIAIPITVGIGVDYSVNIVRRYVQEGWHATDRVLLETGGAVILCSLTTTLGYLSLMYSDNQALRSFGKLAVLGEITCLAAAVLVLPSVVKLVDRFKSRRRSPPAEVAADDAAQPAS